MLFHQPPSEEKSANYKHKHMETLAQYNTE